MVFFIEGENFGHINVGEKMVIILLYVNDYIIPVNSTLLPYIKGLLSQQFNK